MFDLHKEKPFALCNQTNLDMVEKRYKDAFERASDERKNLILETATEEFSSKGYDKANINVIAKNAGISIGLMYKYFATKEDLYVTCVHHGMSILDNALEEIMMSDDKLLIKAEKLIRTTCIHSKKNANYIRLYNEITSERNPALVKTLANEIESSISKKYVYSISSALKTGDVRQDLDPRLFAFFLDDILLSLRFSYTCDYYKERFEIYTGVNVEEMDEESIVSQLLKFIESAFTFEK